MKKECNKVQETIYVQYIIETFENNFHANRFDKPLLSFEIVYSSTATDRK